MNMKLYAALLHISLHNRGSYDHAAVIDLSLKHDSLVFFVGDMIEAQHGMSCGHRKCMIIIIIDLNLQIHTTERWIIIECIM